MPQTLKDTNNLNNTLEKLHFADLVKDTKPVADFSASRQVGWTDVTQTLFSIDSQTLNPTGGIIGSLPLKLQ